MPSADPQHCVRGQYQGYADVPGVASGSATETYVALRLEIDNWRGADVPIFLRAGKALPHTVIEVRLLLRRTPRLAFLPQPTRAEPNQVVLRIDPDPGLRLQLSALTEQSWRSVAITRWASFCPPRAAGSGLRRVRARDPAGRRRRALVRDEW